MALGLPTQRGAQTPVLPSWLWLRRPGFASCEVPCVPVPMWGPRSPRLWKPDLHNCTNSPSCICIKIGCKEQLALH